MKCRTCLGKSGLNSNLKIKIGLGKTIEEIIRLFVPKMIDEKFVGESVCSDCIDTLQVFVMFIERCKIVEKYFLTEQDLKKEMNIKKKLQLLEAEDKRKSLNKSKNQYKSLSSNFLNKKQDNPNSPTEKESFKRKIVEKFNEIVTSPNATLTDKTQHPVEVKIRLSPIPSLNIVKEEIEEFSDEQKGPILTSSVEKVVKTEDCNNIHTTYQSESVIFIGASRPTNSDSELENNEEIQSTNENSFQQCDTEIIDTDSKENLRGLLENNTASSSKSSEKNCSRSVETDLKRDAASLSVTKLKPGSTVSNINLQNLEKAEISRIVYDKDKNLSHDRVISLTHKEIDEVLDRLPTHKIDLTEKQSCQRDTKRMILLGTAFSHCPVCKIRFDDTPCMKTHFKFAHPDLDFSKLSAPILRAPSRICPVCRKCFNTYKLLRGHLREVHKDYRPFRCELCGEGFWKKYSYINHVKNYKTFQDCKVRMCSICKKMMCVEQYNAHVDTHRTFECELCRKKFLFKANLSKHLLCHQNGTIGKQKKRGFQKQLCNICGKMVTGGSNMKAHMLVHTGIRNYLCDRCSKAFKTKSYLEKHINTVHNHTEYLHCEICQQRIKDKDTLRFHMKLKHSTDYTFVCHVCGRGFIRDDYYNRHMKRHLDAPRIPLKYIRVGAERTEFPCKFCHKAFKSIHNLRIHLLAVHLVTARLKCQYCDLTFKNRLSKRLHEKRHQDPKTYELTCKVCWNRFSSKEKLEVHSLKHVGSQKRKCDECGEMFPNKLFLEHHKGEIHFDQEKIDLKRQNLLWEGLSEFIREK